MKIENGSKYILAIVGIVAAVGIFTLLSVSSDTVGAAVYTMPPIKTDTDGDGYSNIIEKKAGTDPFDAASYPMPDLVADEDGTSVYFEGDVYYRADGTVIDEDVTATYTCTIENIGTAAATGSRSSDNAIYTTCYFYDDETDVGVTYYFTGLGFRVTETVNAGESSSYTVTDTVLGSTAVSLFQEIYDGAGDVYVTYDVDYASTSYVTESDETNNEAAFAIAIDSSMYSLNWVEVECSEDSDCGSGSICQDYTCQEVECTSDSDCGSGYVCEAYVCEAMECTSDSDCPSDCGCSDYACYEYTTYGDSTYEYLSTTEC